MNLICCDKLDTEFLLWLGDCPCKQFMSVKKNLDLVTHAATLSRIYCDNDPELRAQL